MRPQTVRTEVIACLADGHWWTVGELADIVDVRFKEIEWVIAWLEKRGFVEKFDDELPAMYGWTVEPKAVERSGKESA